MIRYNPGLFSRVLKFRIVNTQIRVTTSYQINDIEIQTIYISHNADASFISGIPSSFLVPWNVF